MMDMRGEPAAHPALAPSARMWYAAQVSGAGRPNGPRAPPPASGRRGDWRRPFPEYGGPDDAATAHVSEVKRMIRFTTRHHAMRAPALVACLTVLVVATSCDVHLFGRPRNVS